MLKLFMQVTLFLVVKMRSIIVERVRRYEQTSFRNAVLSVDGVGKGEGYLIVSGETGFELCLWPMYTRTSSWAFQ